MDKIIIKGAREHNLKDIDVEIPKNKLVVFTGLSGSGKSSLAFDTIYAEGQRRYVESLSAYARQFLGLMKKPDVDSIEGLSPSISIDQKSTSHNPRSTVGTVTEIYDYLRLLFARVGHPHCPNCGREISQQTSQQIVDAIIKLRTDKSRPLKVLILAPIVKDRKGEYSELFLDLKKKGYTRARIDGLVYSLNEHLVLIKTNKHTIEAIVDRISLSKEIDKSRISDSVEQALRLSDGEVIASIVKDASLEFPDKPKKMEDHLFSERFACPICGISLHQPEPRMFSFNSPHGACSTCSGLGNILTADPELMLNPYLSINEGGILPFVRMFERDSWFARLVRTVCETHGISLTTRLVELPKEKKDILLYGTGGQEYEVSGTNRFGRQTEIYEEFAGLTNELMSKYKETDSDFIRLELEKYMRLETCKECGGARLKKESLSVVVDGKSIVEICDFSISETSYWVSGLAGKFTPREIQIGRILLKEIESRLSFLVDVGLDYLTLSRSANTLAGGEAQRIRLASQIGSGLTGVLYVLDEPSIGLHQRDNKRLIDTLEKLRDLGNTVVVVEHDKETMENSDLIFDFGPGAGEHGGKIVSRGTIEQIKKDKNSLTGKYLSGEKRIIIRKTQNTQTATLTILGASEHNLKNINVSFPLKKFICVTGVSGSGKSTLIHNILYHALMQKLNRFHKERAGKFKELDGAEFIKRIVLIDQSPIGRTPRSNPATYTGIFTYVRDLFANTKDAKVKGYKPGRFSFNVKGGRCEACRGEGQIKIEMQFLPDVFVDCEVCAGKRYNNEALSILYNGKSICEVLNMSVEEALIFFTKHTFVSGLLKTLQTLNDVGLSYIKLGQPAPTLSGGEAQRVKLASELSKRGMDILYLLDEPTTGLHFADLEKLLIVLRQLVDSGNTVIVIEHNLDVIKNADWIIDLGPEGGEKGGEIVAQGTPQEIVKNSKSYTGQFLKKEL